MSWRSALLAGWFTLLSTPCWPLQVTIVNPLHGQPVFGTVSFEISLTPAAEASAVTLVVDGRIVGDLTAPPFQVEVEVGENNRPHLFEVMATDTAGRIHRAFLETPAVPIDLAIDVELQQLYLTATRDGQPVPDLKRDDFRILDNGERQKIVTFERGDVPFVAVLLVDASHSMQGKRLEAALTGATSFTSAMRPLDQAKLILFNDQIGLATPFTSFPQVLTAGLASARARGGTSLNDHLYLSLKVLEARQGRRLVILLTDGIDITSVLRISDVMAIARRSQALVYWIRLGAPDPRISHYSAWRNADSHRREAHSLERLVALSGGRTITLTSIEETTPAFTEILDEVRGQYVIGYYPTTNRGDGRWHRIRVRVDRPGLTVRARQGYLDF